MGTKRIKGDDRALMFLARDVRRRWLMYGESRKIPKGICHKCYKKEGIEVDHVQAVGKRPRTPEEFGPYIYKMFYTQTQLLCGDCHAQKTKEDRKKNKKAS